jgi:hypothetical protein
MLVVIRKEYIANIRLKIHPVPAGFSANITIIVVSQNIYPAVVDHCNADMLVDNEKTLIHTPIINSINPIIGSIPANIIGQESNGKISQNPINACPNPNTLTIVVFSGANNLFTSFM